MLVYTAASVMLTCMDLQAGRVMDVLPTRFAISVIQTVPFQIVCVTLGLSRIQLWRMNAGRVL